MTSGLRTTLGLVLSLIIGLAAYWYLAPRNPSFGMFEGVEGSSTFRFFSSFVATIVGVLLGGFYRNLRALKDGGATELKDPRAFIQGTLRSIDLWLGMISAPIVFSLLLKGADGMNLPGLLSVALQNGFCCLVIINGLMAKAESRTAA